MKKLLLILLCLPLLFSCGGGDNVEESFQKSFKEQKDKGLLDEYVEHYDTLRNNYSNFYYGVSFDGNDNWLSNLDHLETGLDTLSAN